MLCIPRAGKAVGSRQNLRQQDRSIEMFNGRSTGYNLKIAGNLLSNQLQKIEYGYDVSYHGVREKILISTCPRSMLKSTPTSTSSSLFIIYLLTTALGSPASALDVRINLIGNGRERLWAENSIHHILNENEKSKESGTASMWVYILARMSFLLRVRRQSRGVEWYGAKWDIWGLKGAWPSATNALLWLCWVQYLSYALHLVSSVQLAAWVLTFLQAGQQECVDHLAVRASYQSTRSLAMSKYALISKESLRDVNCREWSYNIMYSLEAALIV